MIDTRLILVEGLPGSGKSTTAQFIAKCLSDNGIPNKWWYEEEQGHPVYFFNSSEEIQGVINDLSAGKYEDVIDKALKQWEVFCNSLISVEKVLVIDSAFFGYLTWTLFPFGVPHEVIEKYLIEVESMISPFKPSLIYFYQEDIHCSLKEICDKRGGNTQERFIRNATESKYGRDRNLVGFVGMVQFWQEYRSLTDRIFERTTLRKLAIDNSVGNWAEYLSQITEFLKVTETKITYFDPEEVNSIVGIYKNSNVTCEIYQINGELYINSFKGIWPNSHLLRRGRNRFEIESLPIQVEFIEDKMTITGPQLFDGAINNELFKQS